MEQEDRELLSRALDVLEEQDQHAAHVEEQDERAARVELVKALRPAEPDHRAQAEQARQFIAQAEQAQHDAALAALRRVSSLGPRTPEPIIAKAAGGDRDWWQARIGAGV